MVWAVRDTELLMTLEDVVLAKMGADEVVFENIWAETGPIRATADKTNGVFIVIRLVGLVKE